VVRDRHRIERLGRAWSSRPRAGLTAIASCLVAMNLPQ
jgi:hypothetical protein